MTLEEARAYWFRRYTHVQDDGTLDFGRPRRRPLGLQPHKEELDKWRALHGATVTKTLSGLGGVMAERANTYSPAELARAGVKDVPWSEFMANGWGQAPLPLGPLGQVRGLSAIVPVMNMTHPDPGPSLGHGLGLSDHSDHQLALGSARTPFELPGWNTINTERARTGRPPLSDKAATLDVLLKEAEALERPTEPEGMSPPDGKTVPQLTGDGE